MKVSVIIPTYNRAHLVSEAINSVLNQTYQDFEIIVVDDGSTDETCEKLRPYQDKIKYVYVKNGGAAYARNVGMKIARGKYIAFLDSDDLYYPYKIELQADFLDRFLGIHLVCTEISAFDNDVFWDEFHLRKYHSAYKKNNIEYESIFPESILLREAGHIIDKWSNRRIYMGNIFDIYFQNLIVCTNTIMFRRNVIQTVGLQEKGFGLFHDYEFVLRICKIYKVAFIDIPTYKLRYHTGQISTTRNKNGGKVLVKLQIDLLKVAESYGLKDINYYKKNKALVDRKLAGLHRAIAIPLMGIENGTRSAREHLKKCAFYDRSEYLLWFLTFTPHFVRRISFKVLSILKVIN